MSVNLFEQFDELDHPLAAATDADDLPYAFGRPEQVDAYREASQLRYAAYDAARALAKIGERAEWPEGMYVPGGAVGT